MKLFRTYFIFLTLIATACTRTVTQGLQIEISSPWVRATSITGMEGQSQEEGTSKNPEKSA